MKKIAIEWENNAETFWDKSGARNAFSRLANAGLFDDVIVAPDAMAVGLYAAFATFDGFKDGPLAALTFDSFDDDDIDGDASFDLDDNLIASAFEGFDKAFATYDAASFAASLK